MPPKRKTRPGPDANDNPGGQGDPAMLQILELLRQQTAHLTQQQQQQQQAQPVATFKSFQSVNPPEFKGSADPVEARTWLKEIEKAFTLVQVGAELKTNYASYFLKGEENYWWESKKALEREGTITWERFTELFLEKYFPRYMQNQMELKFFELKQDNLSVAEYEAKFTELARFVPDYVHTDEKRAKRLQQGLKPWIRSKVAVFELTSYAVVFQKAMIIESESDWTQKERDGKKQKLETHGGSQHSGSFQDRFNRRPGFQAGRNFGPRKPESGGGRQGSRPQF